jgi:hypothetical protein
MAWTFLVEDGTGLTNSTSYATVEYADDYFDVDRVFEPTWDAYTTEQKQELLGWATRALDQKVVWKGVRTTSTQALAWPRCGVYNRYGELIGDDEMPEQLRQATVEFAKYMAATDPTTGSGVDYIKAVKLDVLEVEYMDGTSQTSIPNFLNSILRGLGYYPLPGGMYFGTVVKT